MDVAEPAREFKLDADHVVYLRRLLRKLGVERVDAGDIAQSVMLSAHRAAGEFRGGASLETWLFRICVRAVGRYRNRVRLGLKFSDLEELELPSRAATPLDELLSKERCLDLERRLQSLRPEHRAVITMHEIEGRPVREVAECLGVPIQTMYSRLRAARHALRVGLD